MGVEEAGFMVSKYSLTLDEETSRELRTVARELKMKKNRLVAQALAVYFELLDLKLARTRLADLASRNDRLLPAEDVWKKLKV
jgi:predicted transcriptional regulator